jgi:hypothetical protein
VKQAVQVENEFYESDLKCMLNKGIYLRGTSDLGNARVKVDMLSSKFSYEKNS